MKLFRCGAGISINLIPAYVAVKRLSECYRIISIDNPYLSNAKYRTTSFDDRPAVKWSLL